MAKLEDKIVKRMYEYETRHTMIDVFSKILIILCAVGIGLMSLIIILQAFNDQQTFDIFKLFREDFTTIRDYIGTVFIVLLYETPYIPLLIMIVSLILLIIFTLIFIKNFGKIKKRIKAIQHYWRHNSSHH